MGSKLFTITGFVCLGIALVFGLFNVVFVRLPDGSASLPNITNAGAACGFAVAGGLCFLASALCSIAASRQPPCKPAA